MQLRTVIALGLIAIAFVAFLPPDSKYPIDYGTAEKVTWQPNSAAEMRATAEDIDARLDDGEYVFSVMGEYYSVANHYPPYSPRIYHLVSPQHGRIEGLNQTDYHDRRRAQFISDLRSGRIALIVMTKRTDYMLTRWPEARAVFRANFCRVSPTPEVYLRHDVRLYEYAPDQSDCINRTRFETVG